MSTGASRALIVGVAICLASPAAFAQPREIGGIGLTVFADRNFRGQSATLRNNTPNLQAIGLNDAVSSLQVAPGEQWEVCEHANYKGRCVVVSVSSCFRATASAASGGPSLARSRICDASGSTTRREACAWVREKPGRSASTSTSSTAEW